MASDLNRVLVVGRLTADPEEFKGGVRLRLAVNSAKKQGNEWTDEPNFFNVAVFGKQADAVKRFVSKGKRVGVEGKLRWREFQTKDGQKRESVSIAADTVQFLEPKGEDRPKHLTPDEEVPF